MTRAIGALDCMSTSAKIFYICVGALVHTTVFIAVGMAIVVFFEGLSPQDLSSGPHQLEFDWNGIWSWRGQRFALLLLANAVCLPAAVGTWSTFAMLTQRRTSRSEGCLAAICVAVAYPLFIVANMVLLATAPYRIGTVASLSFDALFIFILVWDLLFIPLTVLSHRIVGDMMPMARSGTAPGRWGRVPLLFSVSVWPAFSPGVFTIAIGNGGIASRSRSIFAKPTVPGAPAQATDIGRHSSRYFSRLGFGSYRGGGVRG